MAPFRNQIHIDTLLSQVSVKYKPEGYIAGEVFPEVPVKKSSDLYRVYDRNLKIPETKRANKAEAKQHQWEVSYSSYNLVRHSLKDVVTDSDAENYDVADLRVDTTEELTEKIMMRRELEVAQLFTTTSWSLNVSLAAGAAFNLDTTASNPIPIFLTAASTIIANGGMAPNFGILPEAGKNGCILHQSILDRVKYTSAEVDSGKLAALFQLKQLLVPAASYDTAAIGVAASMSNFYGDVAFVGYKPAAPGPLQPSAGYIFKKTLPLVKRWRDEAVEGEWIEVNIEHQPKVVASLCGYLIKDIV